MSINISALKQFQETFGPAIESIPAVIESAKQLKAVDREINIKRKELEKLDAAGEKIVEDAEAKVASLKEDAAKLNTKRTKLKSDISQAESRLAAAEQAASVLEADNAKVTETAIAQRQAQINALSDVYKNKVVALEADYAEIKKRLDDEIKALDNKRKSVEQSLERLKAKLG